MRKKKTCKKTVARALTLGLLLLLPLTAEAQRLLTLDSCRAMALRNNKQMSVSKTKQDIAANMQKSARTKYLPHVSAVGGYVWTSKEISILSDDAKDALSNLGTTAGADLKEGLSQIAATLPADAQMRIGQEVSQFSSMLDQTGQGLVNALRTDTRNMFAGAVMVTQPVFMGGAIVAANKMADIEVGMAANTLEAKRQNTLFTIDQAYWQVVSLCHKKRLAESYVELVKKLKADVQRLIEEGVATKGDGLSISVRVNEAEMALRKVNDGLVLSKMLLCQHIGLPVSEQITLADENTDSIVLEEQPATADVQLAEQNRPELKVLQSSVDLTRQTTNLLKAGNLPQVLLTGGYAATNPNTFNGFEKKFAGFWNLGVLVRIPIWNWGDVKYKVRASKGATTIANLELQEARDLVELQVNQNAFKVEEANKRLEMAKADIANADENLRMANIGYREGFVNTTTVMEAHTAWLQAQSSKIDAEIDVKLSQVELQKALGTLE
ncbi:MAG: TolC family protein [Prevotella sp.]|jgi:outer membrane protein TolC|nr:TolC family protein [Prevotella sp.]